MWKINIRKKEKGLFTKATLRTSFYEELQKNGWCEITDRPENLTKLIKDRIKDL